MPRKKTHPRKIGGHTAEQMKIALNAIRNGTSIRQASADSQIPFSTLQRYHTKSKENVDISNVRLTPHYTVNKVFTDYEETVLKDYFKKCALLFYGLSAKDCRHVAYQMAVHNKIKMPETWAQNQMAGIDWLRGFRERHPELSLRKPEACSLARATAFNKETVSIFFENLENVIKRHQAFSDGTRIFNLDETGTTTVQKIQKILGPKGHKNLCKVTSAEKGNLCTTCNIIGGGGQALPPAIIFPRVKTNPRMGVGTPPGSLILASPSGWMNTDLFAQVMQHFIKRSGTTKENPSILIMDNHESHLSIDALNLAKNSGVTVLTLHPHTSAKMQPLDVGIHGPFKTYYNAAMDSWMLRNPGCPVTIYEVGQFIGSAFMKAMTPSNIMQSFKKCGIYPFDKNIFSDEDFLPSSITDRQNPDSQLHTSTLHPTESLQNDIQIEPQNQSANCLPSTITESLHPDQEINAFHQLAVPVLCVAGSEINNRENVSQQPAAPLPSTSGNSLLTPDDFRKPFKATARSGKKKPRKLGRSLIATDTPEKNAIEEHKVATKRKKEPKTKTKDRKVVRQVLQSDSEDESELVLQDDSSEDEIWPEEQELDENIVTEESLKKLVPPPKEGQYVIVEFSTKRQKVYYVAKVLEERNNSLEVFVSFLRQRQQGLFYMPNAPDVSYVKCDNIKLILPKPKLGGSTARQQSYYRFSTNLTNINVR